MFNSYNPTYSVQRNGDRGRVCVTDTPESGTPTTRVLLTTDTATADRVTDALTRVWRQRGSVLTEFATGHRGEVCHLRRAFLAALEHGRRDADTGQVAELLEATADLTVAQRRTVADEVGRVYDGTEDILVPVALADECDGLLWSTFANRWLAAETDTDLLVGVAEGDFDARYEGLLDYLRGVDVDVDEAMNQTWVVPHVDTDLVRAWLRRNRPDVEGLLADADTTIA